MASKKNQTTKSSTGRNIFIAIIAVILIATAYFIFTDQQDETVAKGDSGRFISQEEMIKFNKEGELTFRSSDGEFIKKIDIEIAENDHERADGLMMRFKLEDTQGMLFIFEYDTIQSFWMRNTFVPLDMIFVNKNNEIVTIHKNTEILSDQSYRSTSPALYVVEVHAGFTDKYNIKTGDKIVWRRI